ncbi:M28 family peptidase [Cesiribacter andamanensis]|uniref:Arginyl aminopeptidase n=1 Tax=Cesiribacter andamanensis AMV16 TaxID=1279009 RepID=M7NP61_9BACT|nr:M28 family peptidase [Cesiribacter andamanensis]EMR03515.1 Arginyl aminopeptidase [Cesiribacter andamanensis AMV16]
MKNNPLFLIGLLMAGCATAPVQQTITEAPAAPVSSSDLIRSTIDQAEVERHIRFLAADELAGRDVGTPGLEVAARYMAEYFRSYGLQPLPGLEGYFQQVPFRQTKSPQQGQLTIGTQRFALNEGFLMRDGANGPLQQGPVLLLDYGTEAELKADQVKGKWVLARAGKSPQSTSREVFFASFEKQKQLQEMGALGLIELYTSTQLPWDQMSRYLTGTQLQPLADRAALGPAGLPIFWVNDASGNLMERLRKSKQPTVSGTISGRSDRAINSPNVVALIEGTDPELKQEYVLLSAHYDHVGIGQPIEGDSIYNGARDNAIGTTALMMAARYFAQNPPKRSVIIAAWTAEEKGLLGSRWFVEHPPVPLRQIVYNLNIDGAGYNDTTKVTVIGLERTEAEDDLMAAAQAFGLEAIKDPVPQMNLFDRSDNVHFAKAGIPAPTFSQGLTAFDAEVSKYYHQPADEAETINYQYVSRYTRAFVLAAEKVANSQQAPFWRSGDKYEQAGKALYGR